MNQRSLAVGTLIAPTVAITTNTNHTALDVGAGYANVLRREIKVLGGVTMTANTTSVAVKIQENTTSDTTGFADITGATFTAATTDGALTAIHVLVTKRYIRAVTTVAGTTPSTVPQLYCLLEDRDS